MTYDAFLSYSRSDAAQVKLLATRLTSEAGLRVWLDLARLQPGFSWRAEIEAAMNASGAVLIVWGPSGLGPVQRQERDLAYVMRDSRPQFRVIYLLLPGTSAPQGTWANVDTWIHFGSSLDEPDVLARVVAALKGEAPPSDLVADLPDSPTPYRGLAAFDLGDARFFFGRTAYVRDMLERLPHHPFLAVLGPSGSGKTSLIQAGFLAQLQVDSRPGRSPSFWSLVRPGPNPLRSLATALGRLQPQSDPLEASEALLQRLQAQPERLPDLIQASLPLEGRLVLVVDRLEEIFILCQAEGERRPFLDALMALVQHPHSPAWVLTTMRADFYGHVGHYADLAAQVVQHQVYLKPMNGAEVAEVIEAPAAQVGAIFEKGLATQVRTDAQVGEEVALPLLAHTLDLLWRKRRGRWLTWDAYHEIGGVTGALRYHADRVIEGWSPQEREMARRLFMRLIWLEEGAGTMAGRRIQKAMLVGQTSDPSREEHVLQRLADERLIVVRGEDEWATAELVHDTLPLHWGQLRQWVQEDQAFVLWRQRLLTALAEWERAGRDRDALLRRARLAEAERWLAERPDDISRRAKAFIEASREEETDELTRQREEAERYRNLFEEAEQQRRHALARQLVAQAELMRNSRADSLPVSVLLAVEALRRAPSLEAEQTLRRGLALLPRPLACLDHDQSVQAIALSPDGQYLATAGRDHTLRLWHLGRGRELARLQHQSIISAANVGVGVTFSPQGGLLATASGDHTARLWEVPSGREVARLPHEDFVWAVTFSPDGCYLATASQDRTARLWEVPTGRELARLPHGSMLEAVAFGPDGTFLATAGGGKAHVWGVPGGREIVQMLHEDVIRALSFSPDGRHLATASQDHTARLWEVPTGREVARLPHEDFVWAVTFSPDGRHLATASQDRTARVWEVPSGRELARLPHEHEVRTITFSPDGSAVATAKSDRIARVWDVSSSRETLRMIHEDFVWAVAFSPDGSSMVSASADHTARVWQSCGYREVARLYHRGKVSAMALSPDGMHLATGSVDPLLACDSLVQLWEIPSGREVVRLIHAGRISAVVFGPEGVYLATASGDHTARLWETASGRELARLPHDDVVWAVSFSPDSTYLATASLDGWARLWQVSSGREVGRLAHGRNVVAVTFSADGRYLATASADHMARLWETASGRELARLPHDGSVKSVAFSPDDRYVTTASADHTARLWEMASGREMARLSHEKPVSASAFGANGRYLITTTTDHLAYLWLWQPADLIAEACTRLTRDLTTQEWRRYVGDAPYYRSRAAAPARGPTERMEA
jgi:WD40 repeat protein